MNLLAFDVETYKLQPGLLAPPIVCGSMADDSLFQGGALLTRDEIITSVEGWLDDATLTLAGANIAYDFGCVLAARPELFPKVWKAYSEGRVFDVQIAASLNAIADGRMRDGDLYRRDGSKIQSGRYSLAECVKEWLGRDDAKANDRWRLSYALLESTPIPEWPVDAQQYPKDDAVNTFLVAKAQVATARNLQDMKVQVHAAFCIHLGSIWGLRTDPQRVNDFKARVDARRAELRSWAASAGFMRAKVAKRPEDLSKDTKAIEAAVSEAYQGKPPLTETGRTSTSRETLEDSGSPVLEKLAELGRWEKFQTYIPTLVEASTRPLNVSGNPLLSTGRTSYNGLIQLIPREGGVRECFVARPETVISSVDYAAVEMVTLAQVCLKVVGFSDLAEAINGGKDVHSMLGADLLGITYEEFLHRLKVLKDPDVKFVRQAAKSGNFGFPGLAGPAAFTVAQKKAGNSVCEWLLHDGKCGEVKVMEWKDRPLDAPLCQRCLEQSAVLKKGFTTRWPEMRSYWQFVQAEVQNNDCVVQLVSERIRGSPTAAAAANTYFQGLAADGAKRALIKLTEHMYLKPESALYGSRLLLFAHDETLLEIPEAKAHEAAHLQAEIMVAEMRSVCPDVAVKAEPALMRHWTKKAEAEFDTAGRLIPWDDVHTGVA